MESFSGLESSPSNQIESIQEFTHIQHISEIPWLSENIEVDHATINRVAVERLETFSITPSIKSNYNAAVNDTSPLYSLDGWSSKDVKMVKPVKPIKSKRGCYIRYVLRCHDHLRLIVICILSRLYFTRHTLQLASI